jgi:anti-sigma-K factor RskA
MTSHEAEHDRLHEAAGLYALDALDANEREAFEAHLKTCGVCGEEVRSLRAVAAALPHAVPLADPPTRLRNRVMAIAGARSDASRSNVVPMQPPAAGRRPSSFLAGASGWLGAAAMLVVSIGLGGYSLALRQDIRDLEADLQSALARLDRSETQVAVATRSVQAAEARMAVLTAPDLTQVNLLAQPIAPRASGRAFLSRGRGLMFTASNLPPLRAGRGYQLWIVTPQATLSAGMLQVDDSGRVAQTFNAPQDLPSSVILAVTEEPAAGVPAPTGDKYLVG